MDAVEVKNLKKTFYKREPGKTILEKVLPKKKEVKAIDNVSFNIKRGEFVGYIGQNGAGKSTTIKILTGIMHPDSGSVKCLGLVPWKQRYEYTRQMGAVFGRQTLLSWNLPVRESLLLYRDVFELPNEEFEERISMFNEVLGISDIMDTPVRKLSFGEEMKANIVASLLHKPKVLFLDEPTVGLDVLAKERMREFFRKINKEEKTAIMLTTHDVGDIEALCERVIFIDAGKKVYDGSLEKLKKKYITDKEVSLSYNKIKDAKAKDVLLKKVKLIDENPGIYKDRIGHLKFTVPSEELGKTIDLVTKAFTIADLDITQPDLGEVIQEIYKERSK